MEPWSVTIAILIAVLAGAAIPLMFQLWMTIQSARRVAERLDRVTARLEEGQRVDELLAAMDRITHAARQVGDGVKVASAIGAAIGPAAAALISSWRASQTGAERPQAAPSRDGVVSQQKAKTEARP